MRDDFPLPVKDVLAKRVGYRCSNPECLQPTAGPQADPRKAVNIGVAAHITAASAGGPRYDPTLTSEQRTSAENGIWLCQNHGKHVDADASRFTVATLREWKAGAEDLAQRALQAPSRPDGLRGPFAEPSATHALASIDTFRQFPPHACFVHPYRLQRNFLGRAAERLALTEWLTEGSRSVLSFVAVGGMGKSAVTWAWVQRDLLGLPLPGALKDQPAAAIACRVPENARPIGVFWWSFYERNAGFAAFLKEALIYATSGQIALEDFPSATEQVRALFQALQQKPLLLVLDGFERELRAYASLAAAYQGDVVREDDRGDYRTCTSPQAAWFLQAAASQFLRSRLLITSRLPPRELDDLAGCERRELDAFTVDDALAFFRAHEVRGTSAEIVDVCRPYGFHPLSLRLLVGVIVKDKRTPHDIRVARRRSMFGELVSKEHHILQVAYDILPTSMRRVLSTVAAFRSPMAYEALLRCCDVDHSDTSFDVMLEELIDRGWLFCDIARVDYDMHPIARQYAYDRLTNKRRTHSRMRDYLEAVPAPDEWDVEQIEDLSPVVELYHHTIRAGQHDKAFELYRDRLNNLLYLRFAAYSMCVELLSSLFADGLSGLPRLTQKEHQAWVLQALAINVGRRGDSRVSAELALKAVKLNEELGSNAEVAANWTNIAANFLRLGKLKQAEESLQRSARLLRGSGHQAENRKRRSLLGRLRAYQGAFDQSSRDLRASCAYATRERLCTYTTYLAWSALLIGNTKLSLSRARAALKLCINGGHHIELNRIRAEYVVGYALVASATNDGHTHSLKEAEGHLAEALTRCRRINLIDLESDILLAWAQWHRARGETQESFKYATEALFIADRCEYRLKQAESHNLLALLANEEHDSGAAVKHARMAYELAWCDGRPYCYKPAMDEAARMLSDLDSPLPGAR